MVTTHLTALLNKETSIGDKSYLAVTTFSLINDLLTDEDEMKHK